jgi:hypothetical protein
MNTDLTFFTNEADATLLNHFRAKLRDVQFFDVLAGFFRSSGFHVWANAPGMGPQVAQCERELSALVYETYGLTGDEISIVEGYSWVLALAIQEIKVKILSCTILPLVLKKQES